MDNGRPELLEADDPRLSPRRDPAHAAELLRRAELTGDADTHRTTVLEFIASHPDVAHRSCAEGHLTGSAVVVDATGTRTLLMLHRKLGRWFQPGGHADGDTNLAAVALREAHEETGVAGLQLSSTPIDVDVHRVEPPAEAPHLHLDVRFLALAPDGAVEVANEESLALRWVTESELDVLEPSVDASTRRLVRAGLQHAGRLLGGGGA